MIVCKECGNSAGSGDGFCSSCGVLLEWSGQPVEAAGGAASGGPPLAARQPVAERARPGPVPLVSDPVPAGPYCSACGVRNPEGRTFCRSCGEQLRVTAAVPAPVPGWWRRQLDRLRGRQHYEAGRRPRGFIAHDQPPGRPATAAGVTPARPAAARPAAAGATAGGGVGTRTGGARPAAAASPAHLAGSRSPAAMATAAGQRARRVQSPRRLRLGRLVPLLMVASLAGIGLGPARSWITVRIFGLAHQTQSTLTQRYVDVVPVSAIASSSAPGHAGSLAIDGIEQTYWLTGGGGTGATLTVRFAEPENISAVGILSGEPGASYRSQARPETIVLVASGRPPVTLSFDDTPSFQSHLVSLRHVRSVTALIRQVYPGQQGQAAALRELEFFARV